MTAADKETRTFTLLPGEDVLPDDYPVHGGFLYIADDTIRECPLIDSTVADWKRLEKLTEVRRFAIFSHLFARLGDRVVAPEAT